MIKVVIFDVGGVLHSKTGDYIREDIIKTLQITNESYSQAMSELVPLLNTGKITEAKFWQEFIKLSKAVGKLPRESLWGREYLEHFKFLEGMVEIVRSLKKSGLKLAILSNTIATHAEINERVGLYEQFDEVILSHEVGMAKPNPQIYHYTLTKLGVLPQEAIFVDDLGENVNAALQIGMKGILFQDAEQLNRALKKYSLI